MAAVEPIATKKIRNDSAYYTVSWSTLEKAERHRISQTVPAVSGIYEIYYVDERERFHLFEVSQAWYGGLRGQIREKTDPELESDLRKREILNEKDCYYRFTKVNSVDDILDILFFLFETYFPKINRMQSSGRYEQIYLNEISRDKFFDLPVP
jgi:hypothetical protein